MKFIDLFAGIGGFHLALHKLGAECVFASEIDMHARTTYKKNFKKISPDLFENDMYNDDILKIKNPKSEVPDFDILCGGFPCQPFSQAGYKKGFTEDKGERGNMFFHICSILEAKRPKAFFLENVRHILKHDDSKTFKAIQSEIERLGYTFQYKMVKASDFGLPQHRPRIFMVGFRKDELDKELPEFSFPYPQKLQMTMSDVWGGVCTRDVGFTLRVGGRASGIHDRRNWDAYSVDGEVRVLSSIEGKKMMGFPSDFVFPVSETQAMKQLGNSVAVNAIEATAKEIIDYLSVNKKCFKK